ncbi:MAG TPA: pseudouridine synthase [Parachlamydiaceae bacterium]|nr:pseudouridine synthase [Parachlamydiaceae bacterium]
MDNPKTKKRLSKFLAASGVASRRHAEELIFAGKVTVNGQIVMLPQTLVSDKDKILVDGIAVSEEKSKVYYILNKPKGYLCTNLRTKNSKIVLDLFKDVKERLFTVGRLDKDTTGLLLVTNDGHFANSVIHPSKNIQKEYLVKTGNEITHDHLTAISSGTLVEGTFVKPVRVQKVRKGTLKVVIAEGKKREVRMLLEAAHLPVKELARIRIGGLHLGPLNPGEWREMTETDKKLIFE